MNDVGMHTYPLCNMYPLIIADLDVSGGVGVHDAEDAREVDVSLPVLADAVAQRDQARLELLRGEAATSATRRRE